MKRIFISAFLVIAGFVGAYSQTLQASIGPGTGTTRIKIYVRPTGANVNGNISTFQFNVSIPSSITPVPALNFVGTPAFGSGWQIDASYVEDGYRHYQINSTTGGAMVLNNGVELEVMELHFSGGPATANDVSLLTLGNGGGSTGNALFLCTGAANSVEGQLYYVRGGVTVTNNNSYSLPLISSATISGIILPVKWLSFNAAKQNNDALINWSVSDEETNHHYDLQRSLNGSSFTTIATINKNGSGNGIHGYTYTDANITTLGSPVIYYRLKQVDIDSRYSFSEIRKININLKTNAITVYPNPVTDGFYVIIPTVQPGMERNIKLVLNNAAGQVVLTRQISALQAANYYFDVKNISLAGGNYFLQIFHQGTLLETKQLLISKK